MVSMDGPGVLSSELSVIEKHWTKMDLLTHFNVESQAEIIDSPQRQAAVIFLRKCPESVRLIESWAHVCDQFVNLIDDSPSVNPNSEGFVEHRHDQSVFSVLSKLSGAGTFSETEIMQWDPTIEKMKGSFPIQARRDRYSFSRKARTQIRRWSRVLTY